MKFTFVFPIVSLLFLIVSAVDFAPPYYLNDWVPTTYASLSSGAIIDVNGNGLPDWVVAFTEDGKNTVEETFINDGKKNKNAPKMQEKNGSFACLLKHFLTHLHTPMIVVLKHI